MSSAGLAGQFKSLLENCVEMARGFELEDGSSVDSVEIFFEGRDGESVTSVDIKDCGLTLASVRPWLMSSGERDGRFVKWVMADSAESPAPDLRYPEIVDAIVARNEEMNAGS